MFKPIKSPRTFELVAQEIQEAILSGRFKVGERLPSERELSATMKVGRPAIREAIRTLEYSGLLDVSKGVDGGIFVTKPDSSVALSKVFSYLFRLGEISIDQLTEARLLIEKDIVELAMRKISSQDEYSGLEQVLNSALEKCRTGVRPRKENFEFHRILAQFSRNPILIIIDNAIMPVLYSFVESLKPSLEHSKLVTESHMGILREMKKKNLRGALEKVEEHILWFSEEFKKTSGSEAISPNDIRFPDF